MWPNPHFPTCSEKCFWLNTQECVNSLVRIFLNAQSILEYRSYIPRILVFIPYLQIYWPDEHCLKYGKIRSIIWALKYEMKTGISSIAPEIIMISGKIEDILLFISYVWIRWPDKISYSCVFKHLFLLRDFFRFLKTEFLYINYQKISWSDTVMSHFLNRPGDEV